MGMPSAPGKVPKYESKERFSCMITITCLILPIPAAAALADGPGANVPGADGAGVVVVVVGLLVWWDDPHAANNDDTRAAPAAATTTRLR